MTVTITLTTTAERCETAENNEAQIKQLYGALPQAFRDKIEKIVDVRREGVTAFAITLTSQAAKEFETDIDEYRRSCEARQATCQRQQAAHIIIENEVIRPTKIPLTILSISGLAKKTNPMHTSGLVAAAAPAPAPVPARAPAEAPALTRVSRSVGAQAPDFTFSLDARLTERQIQSFAKGRVSDSYTLMILRRTEKGPGDHVLRIRFTSTEACAIFLRNYAPKSELTMKKALQTYLMSRCPDVPLIKEIKQVAGRAVRTPLYNLRLLSSACDKKTKRGIHVVQLPWPGGMVASDIVMPSIDAKTLDGLARFKVSSDNVPIKHAQSAAGGIGAGVGAGAGWSVETAGPCFFEHFHCERGLPRDNLQLCSFDAGDGREALRVVLDHHQATLFCLSHQEKPLLAIAHYKLAYFQNAYPDVKIKPINEAVYTRDDILNISPQFYSAVTKNNKARPFDISGSNPEDAWIKVSNRKPSFPRHMYYLLQGQNISAQCSVPFKFTLKNDGFYIAFENKIDRLAAERASLEISAGFVSLNDFLAGLRDRGLTDVNRRQKLSGAGGADDISAYQASQALKREHIIKVTVNKNITPELLQRLQVMVEHNPYLSGVFLSDLNVIGFRFKARSGYGAMSRRGARSREEVGAWLLVVAKISPSELAVVQPSVSSDVSTPPALPMRDLRHGVELTFEEEFKSGGMFETIKEACALYGFEVPESYKDNSGGSNTLMLLFKSSTVCRRFLTTFNGPGEKTITSVQRIFKENFGISNRVMSLTKVRSVTAGSRASLFGDAAHRSNGQQPPKPGSGAGNPGGLYCGGP
jgi:hypothetical protein